MTGLLDRLRGRGADPWPPGRPVRFITSFNDVFYEASGRRCVETFRLHNPEYELWAYIEADDEAKVAAMEEELAAAGVRVVRLADLPLLGAFLEQARDVIPRELGGDAPPEMFPGKGSGTGDVWFRKHMFRWFRKIVALGHASEGYGDVLFWMDSDCYSKAPLPRELIERTFRGTGFVYMKANREATESGVIGFDLAVEGTREYLAALRDHYTSERFRDHHRWDDGYVFDVIRKELGAPRSRDMAKRAVGNNDVLPTTPFAPYLEHLKGMHGREAIVE